MEQAPQPVANWTTNASLLWSERRLLLRVGIVALALSTGIAFLIPKQYESTASIMPPEQGGGASALLASLAGRASSGLGGLSSLAGGFMGVRTTSAIFMDLLQSRSVCDHIIDRFDLQHVYHQRYRVDTLKYLIKHTAVVEDKKSGIISITYTDTDPERARAITQAYLEELNTTVTRANVSSARTEREFIERRLVTVQHDLQTAQKALSEFSSTTTTLDPKEQTRAMVDATARLQAEVIVAESELGGLEQIYGADNVRVRSARARIASLHGELAKMNGSGADLPTATTDSNPYPSLRQLPRLAVPYANLYRTVRIQETVFELLSQQDEMARIEEAKDTPVVRVIDAPILAEKKSFPPRLYIMLGLTGFILIVTAVYVLFRHRWQQIDPLDPRRTLVKEVSATLRARLRRNTPATGGAQ